MDSCLGVEVCSYSQKVCNGREMPSVCSALRSGDRQLKIVVLHNLRASSCIVTKYKFNFIVFSTSTLLCCAHKYTGVASTLEYVTGILQKQMSVRMIPQYHTSRVASDAIDEAKSSDMFVCGDVPSRLRWLSA